MSFVTINVELQKYTCNRKTQTHHDKPKTISFEVQQYMKTSYEAVSEQTTNV